VNYTNKFKPQKTNLKPTISPTATDICQQQLTVIHHADVVGSIALGEEQQGNKFDYALLLTLLRTWQGWLYLAAVLDLYARKVIGWSSFCLFYSILKHLL